MYCLWTNSLLNRIGVRSTMRITRGGSPRRRLFGSLPDPPARKGRLSPKVGKKYFDCLRKIALTMKRENQTTPEESELLNLTSGNADD